MDLKPKLDAVTATAVGCFAKAGDCGAAWRAFGAINDARPGPERREPAR
ncbi:MAG: hypothetical protein IPF92_17135, partial [Myxococcales bacterium]|nr:hypothetical protein [Myxococcales bacterium]